MNLVILLIWVICLRLVNTYIQIYIQLYFIQKLSFVYYLDYQNGDTLKSGHCLVGSDGVFIFEIMFHLKLFI